MNSDTCEKLYNAYYMQVFSYAMTLAKDRSLAEEIAQETFFKAMASQSRFRQEADVATWLCAIAKNLYFDEKRRQGRSGQLPEEAPATEKGVEQAAMDRDTSFRIHVVLHSLEEPYREVFELRIFGELSFAQIGAIFARTENWARVTYHRARLQLQERMSET